MNVLFGQQSDIDAWMELVRQVRWNFPGLETEKGIEEYRQTFRQRRVMLRQYICMSLQDSYGPVKWSMKKLNLS